MKRKVLASLLVIAVVAGLVGAGTFAWFSDTEESVNNSFTAGILDLELSNDNSTWANGVTDTWVSPFNWAPGDPEVSAWLYMHNSGTTGAMIAKVGGVSGSIVEQNNTTTDAESKCSQNLDNIADYIELTTIKYTEGGVVYDVTSAYVSLFDGSDANSWVSLREFVDSPYCMAFWNNNPPGVGPDYLPAGGGSQGVKLGFTFRSEAGNEYQSDSAGFTIKVVATDDTSGITVLGSGGYAAK